MRADHDLKEFNGERDHVHLLVIYAPKVRLSELVNSLKGVSCRRLKVEFPAISTLWSVRRSEGAPWCPSYFVGSVGGAPIEILRHHIEKQGPLNPGVNAGARRAIRSLAAAAGRTQRSDAAEAPKRFRRLQETRRPRASGPLSLVCLTCRPALRWTLGAAILAKVLRPKYHLYFTFLASFAPLFKKRCPCHAIWCNRFGFVGTSRSVPVQLFGCRVPSILAILGSCCGRGARRA
jgi:hypothetical protein